MSASIKRIIKSLSGGNEDLYGLDHAVLNVSVPPEKMWMNMGYWKDTKSFQDACQSLLERVLIAAKLLKEDKTPITDMDFPLPTTPETKSNKGNPKTREHQSLRLIDVGLGCGDQSLFLTRNVHITTIAYESAAGNNMIEGDSVKTDNTELRPLFDSYVGINITRPQADLARNRLLKAHQEKSSDNVRWTPEIKIFAADAAKPASWDSELKKAAFLAESSESEQSPLRTDMDAEEHTWLLALDTLYHFKPSRKPLFECAYKDMQASIMAFDLLMGESASFWDKLYLRLICLVSGMPYSNFMTRKEYEAMLVHAGYEPERIYMEDISEHVFAGIAEYIQIREAELRLYGMTLGKYKAPGKIFDWWAKSGVIKGFVIVAYRK